MEQKTAFLLIDMQNEGGTSDVIGMEQILQNAKTILEKCRQLNIPVLYTRHINRADGIGLANREPVDENGEPLYYHNQTTAIEVADIIKPEDGDFIIDKYRYSGFYESNLDLMLKGLGVEHLIVGGVLTDVCVLSTVMDAYYRDYRVSLVEDMCGTTTEGAHMAAILMMANWIYDLEVYQTDELCKKMNGESYNVWSSEGPDELQFSPDNMREIFSKLSSTKKK
ncbi:cysteine hydrolase family protein [Sporosarcina ureilytica]|uniref:Isochorismatase n=1 Tax=Sporosarcina ureilytica TaxID=298596 RepID=A0A1D8JJ30_9BACL|nr:isochorismatase family cysteine hydrolase [Sporosarcina ureilytica]AOV08709.1 isochorismatase [Sporosarcina ureilytica]